MSEPIKAGDLVVVVKPCKHCGDHEGVGLIFRVASVEVCYGAISCCGVTDNAMCAIDPADDEGVALDEIKRIPPLDELDDVKRDEEITA